MWPRKPDIVEILISFLSFNKIYYDGSRVKVRGRHKYIVSKMYKALELDMSAELSYVSFFGDVLKFSEKLTYDNIFRSI